MNENAAPNQVNAPDPAYRFTVIYKDGRSMEQEDANGVVVRDHCHIEDLSNVQIYALVNRPKDHVISVNFVNGDFAINQTRIKVVLPDMDMYWSPNHGEAVFKPLCGRRVFATDHGAAVFFFCGWETEVNVPSTLIEGQPQKFTKKKYRRVMFVSEHGEVFFES